MFRRGRGAAPSRAPRRPRLPWRRPGRLLSPSTLSRPLSDYLHLLSVRHTARILIRSTPLPLPTSHGAHRPLPSPLPLRLPHPWDSLRTVWCIPDGAQARGGGEMPRTPLFRNDHLQLGRDSVHLRPTLVALDPEGSALSTVPWRLPLLPFFGYVEAGYLRSGKGKAGNPLHLGRTLLF